MWRLHIRNNPTFGPWYTRVEQQPGWVTRLAIYAAVIVFLVPVLLLTLAAVAVGVVVFTLLAAVVTLRQAVAKLFGVGREPHQDEDGRVNVRVIRRD